MRNLSAGSSAGPEAAAAPGASALHWAAGVDGCRGGWVVALAGHRDGRPLAVSLRICGSFTEVLEACPAPTGIALDMPVGLLERAVPGGRACDQAARALLGRPRASSVFSPPARPALSNDGYRDAILRNRGGMSKQAYNILPRIREVDEAMTPALQERVFETHPELVFARLAGGAMRHPKRTMAGHRERVRCLGSAWGAILPDAARARDELGRREVGLDDVLDACALAYAAACIAGGAGARVPHAPPRDARGLRMEIWY